MIDDNILYQLISQKTMNAESVSWSRFHYFLIFNSILILAWTTVFTANPPVVSAGCILPLISLLGIISGFFWAFLGLRSRIYLNEYIAHGVEMERHSAVWPSHLNHVTPCTTEARRRPYHFCRSTVVLFVMPLLVSATHAMLFYISSK